MNYRNIYSEAALPGTWQVCHMWVLKALIFTRKSGHNIQNSFVAYQTLYPLLLDFHHRVPGVTFFWRETENHSSPIYLIPQEIPTYCFECFFLSCQLLKHLQCFSFWRIFCFHITLCMIDGSSTNFQSPLQFGEHKKGLSVPDLLNILNGKPL